MVTNFVIGPYGMNTVMRYTRGRTSNLIGHGRPRLIPFFNRLMPASHNEALLLTIGGMWELDEFDFEESEALSGRPEVIQVHLRSVVAASAGSRGMSRFDRTRESRGMGGSSTGGQAGPLDCGDALNQDPADG
jgi:hypothetical protein